MSNKHIDDRLTQYIASESMDFDQDAMWATLDSQLNKKRRWLFFILLFSGLLLTSGGIYYTTSAFNNTTLSESSENNSANQEFNTQQNSSPKETISSIADDEKTKTIEVPTSSPLKEKSIQKAEAVSVEKTTSWHIKQQDKSPIKEISSSQSNRYGEKQTVELQQASTADINSQHTNQNLETTNNLPTTTPTAQNINAVNETPDHVATAQAQLRLKNVLSNLPVLENLIEHVPTEDYWPPVRFKKDWSLCEIKEPWKFMVEAYGGYAHMLVNNEPKLVNGELTTDYLNLWEDSQSPVGGYQAGLQFIAQSPGGFEIGAGAEYQELNEKVESERTIIQRIRIFDPMAYFYRDSVGNIVWVADTVTQTVITTEKKTTGLHHRLINIPVRIGYMMHVNDWNLGGHVGAIFHLQYGFDGIAIRQNGTYITLDSDNQDLVYEDKLGFSFTADLHLGRQINDNMELFVRPEFRYHPEDWTVSRHLLSTKIQLAQVSGGLRYTFGK